MVYTTSKVTLTEKAFAHAYMLLTDQMPCPGRVRAQGRVDRRRQLPRPQGGGGPLRRPPQGRQLPASEGREEELGGNDCLWCGGE